MSFKVFKTQCQNCLLSKDRIVPPKRAKAIIQSCAQDQTHFVCHKSSMAGGNTCCKAFFDNFGDVAKNIRMAKWLDAVEWVEQTDTKKLPTWTEINKKNNA